MSRQLVTGALLALSAVVLQGFLYETFRSQAGDALPMARWTHYTPSQYVVNPCIALTGSPALQDPTERMMKAFRDCSRSQVTNLLEVDVSTLSEEDARDLFYYTVSSPLQGICHTSKVLGGRWAMGPATRDGSRTVCMDTLHRQDHCLVYSFGISNDWDFEDVMDSLNCSVRAYDPSIPSPTTRGRHIQFSQMGVAGVPSSDPAWPLDTLHGILRTNGHLDSGIFYLKADIEGEELAALPEWLDTGVLDRVDQLGMELHLYTVHSQEPFHWLLDLLPQAWGPLTWYLHLLKPLIHHQVKFSHLVVVLQRLHRLGFRVIGHDVNTHVKQAQGGYYSFFDVVFMKDNVWNYLDLLEG